MTLGYLKHLSIEYLTIIGFQTIIEVLRIAVSQRDGLCDTFHEGQTDIRTARRRAGLTVATNFMRDKRKDVLFDGLYEGRTDRRTV